MRWKRKGTPEERKTNERCHVCDGKGRTKDDCGYEKDCRHCYRYGWHWEECYHCGGKGYRTEADRNRPEHWICKLLRETIPDDVEMFPTLNSGAVLLDLLSTRR